MRGNTGYNLLNGGDRVQINLPEHRVYNPPDSLQSVGARIMGTGFAGKPMRKDLFDAPKPQTHQGSYHPYGQAPQFGGQPAPQQQYQNCGSNGFQGFPAPPVQQQ
jgi:hypothetical protein